MLYSKKVWNIEKFLIRFKTLVLNFKLKANIKKLNIKNKLKKKSLSIFNSF